MRKKKKKVTTPEPKQPNPAAVALGRLGGQKTAERGPEYYRKLSSKRKSFKGGRPPNTQNTGQLS